MTKEALSSVSSKQLDPEQGLSNSSELFDYENSGYNFTVFIFIEKNEFYL